MNFIIVETTNIDDGGHALTIATRLGFEKSKLTNPKEWGKDVFVVDGWWDRSRTNGGAYGFIGDFPNFQKYLEGGGIRLPFE